MKWFASRLTRVAFSASLLLALFRLTMNVSNAQPVTSVLVAAGGLWTYLDDGSDQGTAWRMPQFDDSSWPTGFAQFGYGELDEETVLSYGPNGSNKHITYYFRHAFDVSGASSFTGLRLSVLRDDGVVVYLNGTELFRNNMPSGPINYRTLASTNVTGAAEDTFYSTDLPPSGLLNGTNVIAVEVHQVAVTSGDLSFDFQLTGVIVRPVVQRGPYLQQGSASNVSVRWRTDLPTDSRVRFGVSPGDLHLSFDDPIATTEHEVRLTNLRPDTKYFYSIGTVDQALAGDESFFFVTAPTNAKPTRIWVIGDSGTADSRPRSVYDAYRSFNGARYTDLWLMLGDNAYGIGSDAEYQTAVFDMFPELLRQTFLYSTIGNHETYSGTFEDFPFLHIFSQPVSGEAGGIPSGTERYYSFDYGNIHFVCMDAMTSDRSSNGVMCTWLKDDLAANEKDWLIAFWHHPPYTKGSHDSDYEYELVEMRENVVPILESYGVDLVLCGHSHSYERSYFINGHYGLSSTFEEGMKVQPGSGREDDTGGAYTKSMHGSDANRGAVYIVAGSSGQATFGSLNHPIMYFDELELGSLVLDITGPVLQARFLRETGAIDDYFTILKGDAAGPLRVLSYQIGGGLLTLTWNTVPGRYYLVERATALSPANWMTASAGTQATGATMSWSTPIQPGAARTFYRVLNYLD